jgi:hypothetical protein
MQRLAALPRAGTASGVAKALGLSRAGMKTWIQESVAGGERWAIPWQSEFGPRWTIVRPSFIEWLKKTGRCP